MSVLLAGLAFAGTGLAVAASAQSCLPAIPAGTQAELADAIDCYNAAIAGTSTTVTLTAPIPLSGNLPVINNATSATLTIEGGGFTVDGGGVVDYAFRQIDGQLTVSNITLTSAFSGAAGAAALRIDGGTARIERSTIYRNGVGICACSDEITTIVNSTISGNGNDGIVVAPGSSAVVQQTTLASNAEHGIVNDGASVELSGSLIVDSGDSACTTSVTVDGGGNALVDASCTGMATTPLIESVGPLDDNGCVTAPCTPTNAHEVGSAALDFAGDCAILVDQRGFPRTPGKCDAGAFEEQAYDCVTAASDAIELMVALGCLSTAPGDRPTTITITDDIVVDEYLYLPRLWAVNEPTVIIEGGGHTIDALAFPQSLRNINTNLTVQNATLIGVWVFSANVVDRVTILQAGISAVSSRPTTITNSTIANSEGAGVTVGIQSDLTIEQSTIVNNGMGIYIAEGGPGGSGTTVTVRGSLLANAAGNCSEPVVDGLGNVVSDTTCTGTSVPDAGGPYDPPNTNGCAECPLTIAIPATSPAIDAAGECGVDTDQRLVERSDGSCDAGAFENGAPTVIGGESYETAIDVTLEVGAADGVLTNDSDPEDDALVAALDPASTHAGTVVMQPDGSFSYTPSDGFEGSDEFTYLVSDRAGAPGASGTATVFVGEPLVVVGAVDDEADVVAPEEVVVDVLENDTAPGVSSLTVVSQPDQGTAVVEDTGIRYVPGVSTSTTDSFEYQLCDEGLNAGDSACAVATVTITIVPPSCPDSRGMPHVATIWGTTGDDQILGAADDDVIVAFGGDDNVDAGDGDNVICAGDGDDTVSAGGGHDSVRAGDGADQISAGSGIDIVWGGPGDDTINGDGGSDWIWGEPGDDIVNAGSGADRVFGGPGEDTLNGQGGQDRMWGGDGNDVMQGNWQSDIMHGGSGNDEIRGARGRDRIYGGAGDDLLFGGWSTDLLVGGPGIDVADGQRGWDRPYIPDVRGCQAETEISC